MVSRQAVCGRRPRWWLADSARRGDTLCRIRGLWGPGLHTCLPRSGCWTTGPELGLWACPSPGPANAPIERGRGRGGTPRPQPSGCPLVGMLRYAASASAGGSPSTPPPCQPATLPLSHPHPVLQSCSLSGSLAALVPDPCVARSLVSNLPGPPKTVPNLPTISCALLSLPTRRLHSTACRTPGHIPPPTTTGDEARRGTGPGLALTNTHERTNNRTNEQASHRHTRVGDDG